MSDPRRRRDGRCAVCEERIPRRDTPIIRQLWRAGRDPYTGDPFCSSVCCRAFHGVTFSSDARKPDHRAPVFGRRV